MKEKLPRLFLEAKEGYAFALDYGYNWTLANRIFFFHIWEHLYFCIMYVNEMMREKGSIFKFYVCLI